METLYVWEHGTVAAAADAVGEALQLQLQLHDSCFYGGDYFRASRDLDQVIVLENFVEDDGEPFFAGAPVGAVCVEVSGFSDAEARIACVDGLRKA